MTRDERKAAGLCISCKCKSVLGKSYCQRHVDARRVYSAQWHKVQVTSGLCAICHKEPSRLLTKHCQLCYSKLKLANKALKIRALAAYGGCCQCCGETHEAFLTLDHIYGDGESDRKNVGQGSNFYRILEKQGFPQGKIRVLCFNCNCGRSINNGICPHQEMKECI